MRAAPLDEAVENALEVASLDVGQSRFQTYSEVRLPLLVDGHSMWGDSVRPDTDRVIQVHMSTDVRGDDRFSPQIAYHRINRLILIPMGRSIGNVCFFCGISSVACVFYWRGVLDCPTKFMMGDGSSLAHPTDIFVRVNVSDIDMELHSRSPGLCSVGVFHHEMSEMWHLFGFLPEFPDTGDPTLM